MPRPKVDPKNRKRTVKACVPCKLSKVRCDSQQPCWRCAAKGRDSACVYTDSSSQPQPQPRPRTKSQSQAQSQGQAPSRPRNANPEQLPTNAQTPPEATRSRMLLSSKGEKVYVGHTASLSYLGFVRHAVKISIGSSTFTENESRKYMLEIDPAENGVPSSRHLDLEQRRALIDAFKESTSGILDVFTATELKNFVETSQFPIQNDFSFARKTKALNAAFNVAIAIGMQVKGTPMFSHEHAPSVFGEGQRFAFEGMLCDVGLDTVKLFLLMTFYMLGACQRNAAFMYLGVAAKAATALGLFGVLDEPRRPDDEEQVMRRKTWESLCVLDTIVCAILGRPASCPMMRVEYPPEDEISGANGRSSQAILHASYNMCSLIDGLEQDIRAGGNVTSSSAEAFLQELRHCSQALPHGMRTLDQTKVKSHDHESRYAALGAVHVACAYYFAVILATRPFMTFHLLLKLKDQGINLLEEGKSTFNSDERLKIANLAQVCLDAAKITGNMLAQSLASGLLLNNMCLIKAWTFGSGLLLGFALFVEENGPPDLERAFEATLEVLLHLAARSPQAKHYHDILHTLQEAIVLHGRKRLEDKRKMASQYLYPMFPGSGATSVQESQTTYPSPLSTEQLDAEMASNFNMDEVLSAGLDVDLSSTFFMGRDATEGYWPPLAWGIDDSGTAI